MAFTYAGDRAGEGAAPGTRQVSNVSSVGAYTGANSAGQTSYQTIDPNANRNGAMSGTWTKTQLVHGNGAP